MNFREPNDQDPKERGELLALMWEYTCKSEGQDLCQWYEISLSNDKTLLMSEVEWNYIDFIKDGWRVQSAFDGDQMIGFILYNPLFAGIKSVKYMYVIGEYAEKGVGPDLANSIFKKGDTILFQCRKDIPPKNMLRIAQKYGAIIKETDELTTWAMEWRYG